MLVNTDACTRDDKSSWTDVLAGEREQPCSNALLKFVKHEPRAEKAPPKKLNGF